MLSQEGINPSPINSNDGLPIIPLPAQTCANIFTFQTSTRAGLVAGNAFRGLIIGRASVQAPESN